jgi:hypothetical protein
MKAAVGEADGPSPPGFDDADLPVNLTDGALRTKEETSSAAVAQIRKYEDTALEGVIRGNDGDAVEGADLLAAPAKGALLLDDLGNHDPGRRLIRENRFQEEMGVRFLHVAIDELDVSQREGQIDRHGRLARPAFSTRYGDHHGFYSLAMGVPHSGQLTVEQGTPGV